MPSCVIYGCGISENKKHEHGLSLFKLPGRKTDFYVKWKKDILNVITKDRVIDQNLQHLIDNDRVWICEKHFKSEDIELTSKLKLKIYQLHILTVRWGEMERFFFPVLPK